MSRRARKKSEVRERILAACGRLFRARGFDETTVADIVAAADVSRQTFFNYFPGKEAVLVALGLAWLREQAAVPQLGRGRSTAGSFLAGARAAIRAQLRAVEADADFMRLVFTRSGLPFLQGTAADASVQRVHADHTRAIFDGVAAVFRAAQKAGEVRRDVPALQIAEMYVAVLLMTIRLWLVDYWKDGVALEKRAMRALDVLEAGLASPPAPKRPRR
jgi:AcrR family transcriptional regulator